MRFKCLFYIILLLGLHSCEESFTPEITTYEEYLVIEGLITNAYEDHIIRVVKSIKFERNGKAIAGEEGALVTINDDLGNVFVLEDHNGGTYFISKDDFVGVPEREYYIRIETMDGDVYESIPARMPPEIEIEEISHQYEERYPVDPLFPVEGFRINLDSKELANGCFYYRFDFEEIWEVMIRWDYPPIEKRHCWIKAPNGEIILENTSDLIENRIVQFPIHYVSTDTDRLRIKYCFALKQYALTLEEYNYWTKLKEISQQIGSLYDPIPASIEGNVYCCNDSTKKVVGYISVNSMDFKRYFITKHDHDLPVSDYYLYCPEKEIPGFPRYTLQLRPFLQTTRKGCVDCTYRGTNIEPNWWDD